VSSGNVEVKSDQVLKPNEWYTVGVGKNLSEAKLTVTYGKTSVNTGEIPGSNLELNVNTNLFVGGINYFTRVQNGNAQFRSFKGCIASPVSNTYLLIEFDDQTDLFSLGFISDQHQR